LYSPGHFPERAATARGEHLGGDPPGRVPGSVSKHFFIQFVVVKFIFIEFVEFVSIRFLNIRFIASSRFFLVIEFVFIKFLKRVPLGSNL
jgi:hypothetical protein